MNVYCRTVMPVAIGVVGISVDDGGGWTRNVVTTVPVAESTQIICVSVII